MRNVRTWLWFCSWMTGCFVAYTIRKARLRSNLRSKLSASNWRTRRSRRLRSRARRRQWRTACTSRRRTRCRDCWRRTRAARSRWCRRSWRARCRASRRGETASLRTITWMPLWPRSSMARIRCRLCRISSCTSPSRCEMKIRREYDAVRVRMNACIDFCGGCCIARKHETEWWNVRECDRAGPQGDIIKTRNKKYGSYMNNWTLWIISVLN